MSYDYINKFEGCINSCSEKIIGELPQCLSTKCVHAKIWKYPTWFSTWIEGNPQLKQNCKYYKVVDV